MNRKYTQENAEKILMDAKKSRERLMYLQYEFDCLTKRELFSTAQINDIGSVKSSKNYHVLENEALIIQDKIEKLQEEEIRLKCQYRKAKKLIEAVDDFDSRECLRDIYLDNITIRECASRRNTSERTVYRWKKQGLRIIDKALGVKDE